MSTKHSERIYMLGTITIFINGGFAIIAALLDNGIALVCSIVAMLLIARIVEG